MANNKRMTAARREEIEDLAWHARANMGLAPFDRVPVIRVLEHVLPQLIEDYDFRVTEYLDGAEAVTHSAKPIITFSNRAYTDLRLDRHRARMTGLHELGHLMLHTGRATYAFVRPGMRRRDIEGEADLFAAAFMMPECAFVRMTSIRQAMRKFGVSRDAACHRARDLGMAWMIREKSAKPAPARKKGHSKRRTP